MNSIVANPGPNESPKVSLGSGELVSMKVVQEIYAELTGKEESLDTQYKVNHQVGYEDIYQLNAKIFQLTEQYNIEASNSSFTIYHQNNQRQSFSSFDRFAMYDRGIVSPTDRLILEYNFLILLPQLQKPQSYKIIITLGSRAATIRNLKNENRLKSHIFFEMLSEVTGDSEIRFVDYSVARNFQSAIKEWFEGLDENAESVFISFAKRNKHLLPLIISILAVIMFVLPVVYYFAPLASNFGDVVRFVALAVVGSFLVNKIFNDVGHFMANSVARVFPLSLIKLTKGDESLAKDVRQGNKVNLINFFLTPVLALGINILSTWICVRLAIG